MWIFFSHFASRSWGMMTMRDLSHRFKRENLHNWRLNKYFFAPLQVCNTSFSLDEYMLKTDDCRHLYYRTKANLAVALLGVLIGPFLHKGESFSFIWSAYFERKRAIHVPLLSFNNHLFNCWSMFNTFSFTSSPTPPWSLTRAMTAEKQLLRAAAPGDTPLLMCRYFWG